MWEELTQKDGFQQIISTAGADDTIKNLLKDLAAGLPDAATALLGVAGGIFGSVLSLVTLTFLALFLVMERPTITTWLFGFTPPAVEARWRPVVEETILTRVVVADRATSRSRSSPAPSPACRRGLLGLPFPIVLAVITGFLDLIPQVGATIAAVILVAVALTVGTTEAVIMLVIQLDLPAGGELHRLPDRLPPRGRAQPVHHDRRGPDLRLAAGRRRSDPRRAVRRDRQDRAPARPAGRAAARMAAMRGDDLPPPVEDAIPPQPA